MKPIVVVGSINIDLVAAVPRIPVLGETLTSASFEIHHGGKGSNEVAGRSKDEFAVLNIGMTNPFRWIVQVFALLLLPSWILSSPLSVLSAVAQDGQLSSDKTGVEAEILRLSACHPTYKLSPPPINMRFVWTQPFDIKSALEGKGKISIEFSIQYAQSASFNTREEAAKTEEFTPNFNLRQRNHYTVEGNHLRFQWRESLLSSHWQRQTTNQLGFACWQTQPNLQR